MFSLHGCFTPNHDTLACYNSTQAWYLKATCMIVCPIPHEYVSCPKFICSFTQLTQGLFRPKSTQVHTTSSVNYNFTITRFLTIQILIPSIWIKLRIYEFTLIALDIISQVFLHIFKLKSLINIIIIAK